jgi:subtilisin family serine protease
VVVQADLVNARGIDGDGVKVAIVEDGRIAGDRALPASRRQVCSPGIPGEPSFHKTAIAGIIQSTDRIYKGMAPRVTLIDGNAADLGDAAVMAAIDCAIERGAVAVNLSFGANTDGAYTGLAAYVDRVVYNTGVSIVVAVSDDCTLRMGSPEVAYNDISVGAFSDRNTTALADDRHTCDRIFDSTFSAYRDPPSLHGDREQPDVVAPGQLIHTINLFSGSFDDLDGTSFAAPHVVGEVALLNERAGPALAHQAERVRAVIMASARHNIEGATRLSDKDGAGAVRFAAADNVLRLGESWWFQTRGGSEGFPHVRTFRATLGQRVRVALVWAHKPGFCSRTVSTNLDLRVSNPVGGTVGVSASQDNNFELVEFTAGATGTYRIRVDDARPSPGAEFVGLAVSRNFN